MKLFTLNLSTSLKRGALVAVLGLGAMTAGAQTFVYQGVIYKASGSKLTAQKAGTAVTVGDAGPAEYTGDIVIPSAISYGGKDYTVTSIGSVFKGTKITSIEIGDGVATISRGAFQGDSLLARAVLPSDLVTINADLFSGCVSLEEIVIPGTAKEIASNQFKGCTNLKKITFAEGPTALELSAAAFTDGGSAALEDLVINRQIGTKYTDVATKPFRGAKALKNVTIGGSFTSVATSYFENVPNLTTVTFNSAVTELGTNVFAGSGITEITLPETVTSVPASTFQNCRNLRKVVLGSGVTSISDMAFYNSTVSDVNFPASLKSIGQMAFSGAGLTGQVVLPEALTTLGVQAFANNAGITAVSIPVATKTIGDGAFMGCPAIASYTVADGNESFKGSAANDMIVSADGLTLKAFAPASASTAITGAFTTVSPYAAYMAKDVTEVSLPDCANWGDYSFAGTSISKLTVQGTVGRYVATNCAKLTDLTIEGKEVPFGIAANNAALTNVKLNSLLTTVKQDAFTGCTALQSLDLGSILAIIEADAFKGSGIKTLTVAATNPAAMADGVFTSDMDITVKVPVDLVDTYKAATGWKELNITGDANIAAGPSDMGMPNGLYYANPDGKIYAAYADGNCDSYDVGGVPHTFQLVQFKNRIYGASAGTKFVYSATGSVDGDGKLFYLSQVGGETFQAVVLDNTGNNAYKDPFGLYIYGDTLYVNDRNVCIRKISADAIALPQDYKSWVENNWLGFYGSAWNYGCIKSGWAITEGENAKGDPEPVYWVGMKYNGNGIYRFREQHVGSASTPGAKPEDGTFLNAINPIFTTFHIDEANGHMYIYIEKAGSKEADIVKGGVYRINVADLEANPDPTDFSDLKPILIDGAPVKYEGSATNEHVGISQFSPDEKGEYLYWCYRAPSQAEADENEAQDYATANKGKYWWAEKFDATNPLHQTGIKRIKLGEANPKVEMVVPGAEGYGVVPVNYEGSVKPSDSVNDIVLTPETSTISYANGYLTVTEAAAVIVYNAAGAIVTYATLGAGESLSVADLQAGVYVAVAGNSAVKFVK